MLTGREAEEAIRDAKNGGKSCVVVSRTETRWFRDAVRHCTAFCFLKSRLPFGNSSSPGVVFYFGGSPEAFKAEYEFIGEVVCKPR